MSDQPTTTAPVDSGAPIPTAPAEPVATAPTDTPPWGDDFDPAKAWSLVQNLRSDKERLQQRPTLTPEQQEKLAEYDRLAEASQTELERAQKAAETNAARAQALLGRTVKAEVKVLASEGFADPEDAAAFLDLSKYANGDGDVDSEAIKKDLADLLAKKPHLGKSPTTRTPAPNPAQGASGSGAPSSSEDDSYPSHWLPQKRQ